MTVLKPFLILSAAVLTACATSGHDEPSEFADLEGDPRLGASVSSACLGPRFDGFGETTRDSVVIEGRGRSKFLLTTRACFNLRDALQLGIDNRGSCVFRGDRLIVSDSGAPAFLDRSDLESCFITGIYEWNEDATKPEDADEGKTED